MSTREDRQADARDWAREILHGDGFDHNGQPIAYATGAIVTERQRCICDDICLDHCRACNYSGRDLEEMCIADPDWVPDDEPPC